MQVRSRAADKEQEDWTVDRTREAKTQRCDDPSRWYRLAILSRWVDAGMRYMVPSNEWSGTTTFQPGWGSMMATSFACLLNCLLHHHRQILDLGLGGCVVDRRVPRSGRGMRRERERERGERPSRASDPVLSARDEEKYAIDERPPRSSSQLQSPFRRDSPRILFRSNDPLSRSSTSLFKRSTRSTPTKQTKTPAARNSCSSSLPVPMPGNLFLPALTTSRDRSTAPLHTDTTKRKKGARGFGISETLKWAFTQKITCSVRSKTSPRNIPAKDSNDVDT